jgi:hypothetical protein
MFVTSLETYNYDTEQFEEEDTWPGDVFDEWVAKWKSIFDRTNAAEDGGQAWRVLLRNSSQYLRAEYVSRPEGF